MELQLVNRALDDQSELPTATELKLLRPGLFARLQLKSGGRFWCRVTSQQRPNKTYTAIADDSVAPIKRGDVVIFGREHVYEIV